MQLSPWYLNTRRLALLTKRNVGAAAQASLADNSLERATGMHFAANLADSLLRSGQIPNLTKELIANGVPSSSLTASIWGVFTFRGVSKALMAEREGRRVTPATFSGVIPIGTQELEFSGVLLNDHLYSQSAPTYLTGKRRALILGQFEIQGYEGRGFPIHHRRLREGSGRYRPLAHGMAEDRTHLPITVESVRKNRPNEAADEGPAKEAAERARG